VELVKLQEWVKKTGARIVIVFEGRDAAGKDGTIKRIMERVSPRVFRLVALRAATDRQKTQLYALRYMAQMPVGGEIVIFDRGWYNRAGVEHVMGFCTDEEYKNFLKAGPPFCLIAPRERLPACTGMARGAAQSWHRAVCLADTPAHRHERRAACQCTVAGNRPTLD